MKPKDNLSEFVDACVFLLTVFMAFALGWVIRGLICERWF